MSPETFRKFSGAMKVFTGGGNRQILIRYDPEDFPDGIYGITIKSFGEHEEIRIKGNGGYVVGPGSLHSSGKLYTTKEWNLEPFTKDEVDEILGLLHINVEDTQKRKKKEYSKSSDEYDGKLITFSEDTIYEIISLIRRIYTEGNRHDIIFSLSGIAHKKFVSEQSMINLVESLEKYGISDSELDVRIASIHATFCKSRSDVNSLEYLKNILYARIPYFESIKFIHRYIDIIEASAKEQGLGHLYSKNKDRGLEDDFSDFADYLRNNPYIQICINPVILTVADIDLRKVVIAKLSKEYNKETESYRSEISQDINFNQRNSHDYY